MPLTREEEGDPQNYFRALNVIKGFIDRDIERMKKTLPAPSSVKKRYTLPVPGQYLRDRGER